MDKLSWIAGEKAETKQLKKCFDEITTKGIDKSRIYLN